MRRWRALIHPALLAPDGLSGEVRQWQDFSFLLRLCPFFMCDSLGACSRRRTTVTSRHLVMIFQFIAVSFLSLDFACSLFHFSHACGSDGCISLQIFGVHFPFRAWSPCFSRERERDLIALPFLAWFPCFSK